MKTVYVCVHAIPPFTKGQEVDTVPPEWEGRNVFVPKQVDDDSQPPQSQASDASKEGK